MATDGCAYVPRKGLTWSKMNALGITSRFAKIVIARNREAGLIRPVFARNRLGRDDGPFGLRNRSTLARGPRLCAEQKTDLVDMTRLVRCATVRHCQGDLVCALQI
eukprot:IDg22445t1